MVKGHPSPPPPPPARPIPAPRKSRRQPLQGQQFTGTAASIALPAATAVPEAPPAAAAILVAQPAAVVPGGRPAVPMAPVAPPAVTAALPPVYPAYQIVATLLQTLRVFLSGVAHPWEHVREFDDAFAKAQIRPRRLLAHRGIPISRERSSSSPNF
ncbi:hypothetical protein MRX96_018815 [Rhipicephalus microplus]